MNSDKQTIADDEIDLREIILTLWKEKFLILIITLTSGVAGYIYGNLKPKVYQTTISFRDIPDFLFERYREFIFTQQLSTFALNFNNEFKSNLLSGDLISKFVEETEKGNGLKLYLKEKNINSKDYFKDKLQLVDQKNNTLNQLLLTYSGFLGLFLSIVLVLF